MGVTCREAFASSNDAALTKKKKTKTKTRIGRRAKPGAGLGLWIVLQALLAEKAPANS